MSDYMTSADSGTSNTKMLNSVPNTTLLNISNTLALTVASGSDLLDDAGLPFSYGSCKILDLLGYGSFLASNNVSKKAITSSYLGLVDVADAANPLVYKSSQVVNLLPLLAYQKVYFDFFSNSQWEKHLAYSYNVDYWDGTSQLTVVPDMLKLRYANYPKDYFMGILPNSQYGPVAVLSPLDRSVPTNVILARATDGISNSSVRNISGGNTVQTTSANSTNSDRLLRVNSDLSALSLRSVEYLQRWKEVVQFSSKDYSDQMAAQFGIKAPEYMGNHSHYIGGWSNVININEVLNTNLTADNSQAVIAGRGEP